MWPQRGIKQPWKMLWQPHKRMQGPKQSQSKLYSDKRDHEIQHIWSKASPLAEGRPAAMTSYCATGMHACLNRKRKHRIRGPLA